jgi:hypothetical protein
MNKNIGLFLFLVSSLSFASQAESATTTTEKLHIGDYYQGGVIYWLDARQSYKHGLIADIKDAPNASGYAWDPKPPSETKARADKPYTGKTNTKTIIASIGDARAQAANACASSQNQGYSDWYLPAKMELTQLLSRQKNIINATKDHDGNTLSNSPYWSSTEYRINSAWNASNLPGDGVHSSTYKKNIPLNVRCIRSF